MQMQPVVMAPPSGADFVRFLKDNRAQAARLEPLRGGEARWPGAYDNCFRRSHPQSPKQA